MFLAASLFFIALSLVLGLVYAKGALAPVHRLTQTIQSIEKGDLSRRVPLFGAHDELRELGETFNRMIERIEKLVSAMRESLDDIAHDIRTPITRIRNVAESAILSESPEEARQALQDCAENMQEISTFVDQLLEIAEADSGALPLKLEQTDISRLLDEVCDLYQHVAEEKQIVLHKVAGPKLLWPLDQARFKRVLANLVDNAVKFSPSGTEISISTFSENSRLVVEIADQGPGITAEDMPRIWERLYRGDKSRSVKGAGLGLAVVRSIVLAHGGQVSVRAATQGGSTFRVALPPARAANQSIS